MPSADRLREFVVIFDAGSISSAARQLGVPRATLSRRLRGLEEELNVRLFQRNNRQLRLTYAGEQLIPQARQVLAVTEAAWAAVRRIDDQPRGRLRVSLPPAIIFGDLLIGFAKTHPDVEMQIISTERRVDLIQERVDVALRFGSVRKMDLIARRIWNDRLSPVASPQYLAQRGRPTTPAQLIEHDCLLGFQEGWREAEHWPLRAGGSVPVSGKLVTNELITQMEFAVEGMGIALLPDPLTASLRALGRLDFVLAELVGREIGAFLVYPQRAHLPSQVRAFIDYTATYFQDGRRPTLRHLFNHRLRDALMADEQLIDF
ncbi:MAG: LysR family transcriptional regulator [Myxococcota bacterium]